MSLSHFTGVTPRLPVLELRRTIAFYTRMFDFRVSVLWPEVSPTFAILDRDAVSLGFFTADAHRGPITIGTADLYLGTEDVRALHSAIKDIVRVEWGPEVYVYGRREFAVRDPDGYLLIFSEPTDEPPTCPED